MGKLGSQSFSKLRLILLSGLLTFLTFFLSGAAALQVVHAVDYEVNEATCTGSGATWESTTSTCTISTSTGVFYTLSNENDTLKIPLGTTLVLANTGGFAISSVGTITNQGTIEIKNTLGQGIHMSSTGVTNNEGIITVANTGGTGILVDTGIVDSSMLTNNNIIVVTTSGNGIINRGTFTSCGIEVAQGTVSGPVSFVCPVGGVEYLIGLVNNDVTEHNIRQTLLAPLNQSLKTLTDNNTNNDGSSCNTLDSFLGKVDNYSSQGDLTVQQTETYTALAVGIKQALGC